MTTKPLIVLKFGGSVLVDESGLRRAVHEIYRWRRDGWQVIAVVSSLAGRTDQLLERCDGLDAPGDSSARAALVAVGELESAALLNLYLERAGLPATLITPEAAGLIADGDPTDANPVSLDPGRLSDTLKRHDIVVFPGYIAASGSGRTVVLGRGGSDLSALFLAAELRATRCRLIKDVDGLYESDPAGQDPRPQRFATAGYDDALSTDGSIIQHKAIRFAQERGLEFELGAFNAETVTRIGHLGTRLESGSSGAPPLSVGLLGHGTVGGGVSALLADYPETFTLAGVAIRHGGGHPELGDRQTWTDPVALAGADVDIVVETLGGVEVPDRAAIAALDSGAHLVTANKALLSRSGAGLAARASRKGRSLRFSASVGASLPILEAINAAVGAEILSVEGILCGTANFVLERLESGEDLMDAVAAAQTLGLAETDPSRDLDGRDAADKLCVIAATLGGKRLDPEQIERDPFISADLPPGTRQIARLEKSDGSWIASIKLAKPAEASFLHRARGSQNALILERSDGTRETLLGQGAGRWPTAEAIMADLLDIAREEQSHQANVRERNILKAS